MLPQLNDLRIYLNLNVYQAKVLLSLFEESPLTVSQINKKCKVPRSRIYDIGESLADIGFVKILNRGESPVQVPTRKPSPNNYKTKMKFHPLSFQLLSKQEILKFRLQKLKEQYLAEQKNVEKIMRYLE